MKVLGEGRIALSSNSVCMAKLVLIFKPDIILIHHQLEFSGTRVKYLDHEKMAYKHEIWSYPKKPLIIANSGVSRETRCLKVVWSLLQPAYFVYARNESPGEVMTHAGSSEATPHADVIRTIISCADQFKVLIFHCGPLSYFLIQYYNLKS